MTNQAWIEATGSGCAEFNHQLYYGGYSARLNPNVCTYSHPQASSDTEGVPGQYCGIEFQITPVTSLPELPERLCPCYETPSR